MPDPAENARQQGPAIERVLNEAEREMNRLFRPGQELEAQTWIETLRAALTGFMGEHNHQDQNDREDIDGQDSDSEDPEE